MLNRVEIAARTSSLKHFRIETNAHVGCTRVINPRYLTDCTSPLFRTFEQIENDPSRGSTEGTEREIGWCSWDLDEKEGANPKAAMIEVAQLNRAFRDGCN